MLNAIHTLADVEKFFQHLIQIENLNFNPDEDFENYINQETKLPSYSTEEALLRNELMTSCFDVCERDGADIYEIGYQTLFKRIKNIS